MLLFILVPTILLFIGITIYISYKANEIVYNDAEVILEAQGESIAGDLQLNLEKALTSAKAVAQTFQGMLEKGETPDREAAIHMLEQLIINNPEYVTTWMFWEENAFDGKDDEYINEPGHDETGLFIPVWLQTDQGYVLEPQIGYDEEGGAKELIDYIFEVGDHTIYEPIFYEIDGTDTLITSIVSPVVIDGETLGMVGVDFSLEIINEYIAGFSFYDTGFAGLISNSGIVLAHQDEELIGTNYLDSRAMANHQDNNAVATSIESGEKILIEGHSNLLNADVYRLFTPVIVDGVSAPWSAFLSAPIEEVTKEARDLAFLILFISLAIVILLALIILFVTNGIVKTIRAAVDHGREMSEGDFTRDVPEEFLKMKDENGELAHIFKVITNNMRELIGEVQNSSTIVLDAANSLDSGTNQSTDAAHEVAEAIEEISRGTEEQMQSAEESAKAMEDMAEGVQQVATSANLISEKTDEMDERSQVGQETVDEAISQMEQIQKETQMTKSVIENLDESTDQIGSIVDIITDISEQTNLLALNATIEAARAGEHGQGFAVVSNEVHKLADETKDSALNIQQLVKTIQENTVQATETMDKSESEVKVGMERIVAVRTVFNQIIASIQEIVGEIDELATIAEEMSAMSEETAAASEEIANAAEVASGNTQQVAAAAEEQLATMEDMKHTSHNLKDMATELNNLVNEFRI